MKLVAIAVAASFATVFAAEFLETAACRAAGGSACAFPMAGP
jgi:hypothetical protein